VSAFTDATIVGLCQSVVVPTHTPLGDVTLRLEAGPDKDHAVKAHNLYIDLDQLDADAVFKNINIGVAAGAKDQPGPGIKAGDKADPNSFAQTATSAHLTNVRQTAWATSAGTFKLTGLSLRLHLGGGHECY